LKYLRDKIAAYGDKPDAKEIEQTSMIKSQVFNERLAYYNSFCWYPSGWCHSVSMMLNTLGVNDRVQSSLEINSNLGIVLVGEKRESIGRICSLEGVDSLDGL